MESHRRSAAAAATPSFPDNGSSTLQKLKDRARSVDRYFSETRLNLLGTTRGAGSRPDVSLPPTDEPRRTTQHTSRGKVNEQGPHDRHTRWRSPSINSRLQQNLQNFVGYLFERKNDARKRALAEQLLWTAVRRNELALFRDILSQIIMEQSFNINAKNEFGWNLVDEAVMLGYVGVAAELFANGAKETQELGSKQERQEILKKTLRKLEAAHAAARVRENPDARQMAAEIAARPSVTVVQQMIQNVERTRPPRNYLDSVVVEQWGETTVAVHFEKRALAPGVISRFKVEWSNDRTFTSVVDYQTFYDTVEPQQLLIHELTNRAGYYFRMSVANLAGYGLPQLAHPTPLFLTSWREVDGIKQRYTDGVLQELQQILWNVETIHNVSQSGSGRGVAGNGRSGQSRAVQRRPSLKDSIKAIIKPQSKISAIADGGLFLGCLLAAEDSVLLTTDYTFPVVSVQSPFLGTISAKEFLWLQKLSSSWSLTQPLKELLYSSKDSTSDLRFGLLQAAIALQNSLSLDDLGSLYFHPISDDNCSVSLLLLIRRLEKTEEYRNPGSKWVHVKEAELMSLGQGDQILSMISSVGLRDLLAYNLAARTPLPAGLHIGYLELKLSLDNVSVLVSDRHSSILPSHVVRDKPHISSEEWQHLLYRYVSKDSVTLDLANIMDSAWNTLKNAISVRSVAQAFIYEEIVEIDANTSMIVVFSEKGQIAARQSLDEELRRGTLLVAVQTLECEYFSTYRKDAWSSYCQSALLLEAIGVNLLQQQREAFTTENEDTKALVIQVQQLQDRLERTWNQTRWLPDLIRTITSRSGKRTPLYRPVVDAYSKALRPPRAAAKNIILELCDPEKAPSTPYDNLSVTVVIKPKPADEVHKAPTPTELSPYNRQPGSNLQIKVTEDTTAKDVVREILSRSLRGLTLDASRFYNLWTMRNGQETALLDSARIKHVLSQFPDAKFFLRPRLNS